MHYVPPSFWAQADGDVRLWVPFNGNLSTDISAFGHGAGTNTGATITGGQIAMSGTTQQQIVWGPSADLVSSAGGFTIECFITWTSSDNVGQPGGDMLYATNNRTYNFHPMGNAGRVRLDTNDFGAEGDSAGNVLSGAGKVHVAMVRPAGSTAQTISCYVAGVRVITFLEPSGTGTLTTASITVGKAIAANNAVIAQDDIRLTLRQLYSGASFTPPTSPL